MKNSLKTIDSQQKFRSEKHNVFTEEVGKVTQLLTIIKEFNQ